jgi:hypothetical protein
LEEAMLLWAFCLLLIVYLGDTFRWKGENISTTEVAQVIGAIPIVADANVYGVPIPGHEGKAGCVALVLSEEKNTEDWKMTLAAYARSKLPNYAIPVFVRVLEDSADMATGNNKQLKAPFQAEGIDPDLFGTKVRNGETHTMYWLRPGADEFVPYTKHDWIALHNGRLKL